MNEPEYDFGFAIETTREEVVEQNFRDWRIHAWRDEVVAVLGEEEWRHPSPQLKEQHWDRLNEDFPIIERNIMDGLRTMFDVVRGEGHSGEELVGTIVWWPSKRKQAVGRLGQPRVWPLGVLAGSTQAWGDDVCIYFPSAEEALPVGFDYHEGTSALAKELVDASVMFFDLPADMKEMLEQAA